MEPSKPPSFMPYLPVTVILNLVGWGGLVVLVNGFSPDLGPRWLFYFFLTLALGGFFLPMVYFFNRRFPSKPLVEGGVILREALWFGIYAGALTWLQWGRMLNLFLALFLAGILLLIEVLLRMREHSHWKPEP
jgi:hypothetical protein